MSKQHPFSFGYHWIWTYGHLIPTGLFAIAAALAHAFSAPAWLIALLSLTAIWAFAGFIVSRCIVRMNDPLALPTQSFLANAVSPDVLDIGVGAGRASIMVGHARPGATIVGLDNFSADYIAAHGPANTLANFERAGIAKRARLETADMRQMPFAPETFDGAVSSAAIDHLEHGDILNVLADVNRFLKPNGEFLLLVIVPNIYTAIAYGALVHLHMAPRGFWRDTLRQTGFTVSSEGTSRGVAWFHARKGRALAPSEIAAGSAGPKRSAARAFNLRELAITSAMSGAVCIAAALILQYLGYSVSGWWVAAAIPIGMHAGIMLVAIAAALRWLISNRKSNPNSGQPL